MNVSSRIVGWLLILALVAKGSVAAMLSVTGAAGYAQPAADVCPFVALTALAGSHEAAAWPAAHDEAPAIDEPAHGNLLPHHHHPCSQLCQLQGALPASAELAVSSQAGVPVALPTRFSSFVASPARRPPRASD